MCGPLAYLCRVVRCRCHWRWRCRCRYLPKISTECELRNPKKLRDIFWKREIYVYIGRAFVLACRKRSTKLTQPADHIASAILQNVLISPSLSGHSAITMSQSESIIYLYLYLYACVNWQVFNGHIP